MRKAQFLLQSKSGSKHQLYIYIESDAEFDYKTYYGSFTVQIKVNGTGWQEIPIKEYTQYRGSGTVILLDDSEKKYGKIFISPSEDDLSYISVNGMACNLDSLDISKIVLTDTGKTLQPNVPPLPEVQEGVYDYSDLDHELSRILKPYACSLKTDIFEHTMLRLASISFPFHGFYKFSPSDRTPDYFFMDLGLATRDVAQFVKYLNDTY